MELLIALLSGAMAAMLAAGVWLSPRLGWLLHAGLGACGGAVGGYILAMTSSAVGDTAYLIRLVATTGLCGAATLWTLGAAARLLRR